MARFCHNHPPDSGQIPTAFYTAYRMSGDQVVREKNWRLVVVGAVLIVLAVGFFIVMMSMAAKSTDPKGLMQTVGQVSGVVCGISVVMIIAGLIGRKIQT